MKPGQSKIGQRVRTLTEFRAYPEVKVGTEATIVEVVAQHEGAEDDSLLIHPRTWGYDDSDGRELCLPCLASDVELVGKS